jgi:hypothetical protein
MAMPLAAVHLMIGRTGVYSICDPTNRYSPEVAEFILPGRTG